MPLITIYYRKVQEQNSNSKNRKKTSNWAPNQKWKLKKHWTNIRKLEHKTIWSLSFKL